MAPSRKQSREVVFRLLFQLTNQNSPSLEGVDAQRADVVVFNNEALEIAIEGFQTTPAAIAATPSKEGEFIRDLCDACANNIQAIDEIIKSHSKGFAFDRIFKTDLTALRMGIAEIKFFNGNTPPVVAVNEAVEIAKKYGTEKSGGFVNGILANFL